MGRNDVADLRRLMHAHHEAGHAIAHTLAGYRVHRVTLEPGTRGGFMTTAEDGPDPDRIHGWLVMLLAGGEAATRFLTKNGYGTGEARRIASGSCNQDRGDFRRDRRGSGISEGRARADARTLVSRHWGRIHRVAVRLDRKGRLSGSQL
jgi:hypothetical protein